ncbi:hypothetical protein CAPTEDRAFT_212478, partial [Capitella teleta]
MAAGVFLLFMVLVLGPWVKQIPMAALVAVMIMVAIGTFNWGSVRNLTKHPKSSSFVMLATVVVVVSTHDLAKGVFVGVLLSGIFFANKVGRFMAVESAAHDEGRLRRYKVTGQVFFASSEAFIASFDFKEVIERVRIDVSRAHFWDITAISALDSVVLKFRREGVAVEVLGLNQASATLVDKFAIHDKPGAAERESLMEELSTLDERRSKIAMELGRDFLEHAKQRAALAGITQLDARQRHGTLVTTLVEMESELRLAVLGPHLHDKTLPRHHLDHTVENVVRSVRAPVLLADREYAEPRRFAVAFDGSSTGRKMIQTLATTPLLRELSSSIVMASEGTPQANAQADWARTILSQGGFSPEVSIVDGNAEE